MHTDKNPAKQALRWLLPTVLEVSIYLLIALLTMLLSNIGLLQDMFLMPKNSSISTAVLSSSENLLAGLVGPQAAATLITAIFWGAIGMGVYVFIWLFKNFSTELSNDLSISRYIHPRGSDTYLPLKSLFLRLVFQFFIGFLAFLYISATIKIILPLITSKYQAVAGNWTDPKLTIEATSALIMEILVLHVFTILLRLLLLKKRVFGLN